MMRKFSRQHAIAAALFGSAVLFATPSEARLCSAVRTDLDAELKARDMYASELVNETDDDRRDKLTSGIDQFDRNIERYQNELNSCEQDPANPDATTSSTGGGESGGTVTDLEGNSPSATPFDDRPVVPAKP